MQGLNHPIRSISLPSRLNPNPLQFEDELNKLKKWESSSSSMKIPSKAESIQMGLVALAELYNSVADSIKNPVTQQTLFIHSHEKLVEEALDKSVGFLDLCSTARDLIMTMKANVQDLQSALRRSRGDSSMESHIYAYISFRKKSRKDIAKFLREMKRIESKMTSFHLLDVGLLTMSVFRSLVSFFSAPEMKTRAGAGGWSLVSKLMGLAGDCERGMENLNEVGLVDVNLSSLHDRVRTNKGKIDVAMIQKRLEALDVSIISVEDGLDGLFRGLIRYRVSLLNILTPC